jgi:uncharacterized protein
VIFDADMHPIRNPFSRYDMSIPGANLEPPEMLEELMAAEGIGGAMLLSQDGRSLTEYVEAVETAFGLFWAAPRAPSAQARFVTFVDEAAHWLEHPKIVGIKLHPLMHNFDPGSPMMDDRYELAGARGVPVLLHTGPEFNALPWTVAEAARRHPGTRFVPAHMGLSTLEYVDGAIDVAEAHRNIMLETSGMPFLWKIREAVDRVGEERVRFGSDAPFFSTRLEIEKIRLTGLDDTVLERVLGANALDVYLGGRFPSAGARK